MTRKKFFEFIGMVAFLLLMTAAVLVFLAPRFGWMVDSVYSGSMRPAMKVGGVVITRPATTDNIKIGDIITFNSPHGDALTSHRVVAIEKGPTGGFQTKGDANEDVDPFIVPGEKVVGVVCFHLPYLGYLASFMKTRIGLLLTICVPGVLIIVREVVNIWRVIRLNET
jgi:signal peptidase I